MPAWYDTDYKPWKLIENTLDVVTEGLDTGTGVVVRSYLTGNKEGSMSLTFVPGCKLILNPDDHNFYLILSPEYVEELFAE